jgi:hypothetical protein
LKPKLTPVEPGSQTDPAFFLSAPEISIFVACCVMINELRGLERSLASGEINSNGFQEKSKTLLLRLTEAADATQRFDVVWPVMGEGRFSPYFWRWFNWWDDYLKGLTPSRVAELERDAREHGSLIEELRPKGHWVRYRSTAAEGV